MPRKKVEVKIRENEALVCFLTCKRCKHEVVIDPIDPTEVGLERMRQECPKNEDNWYVAVEDQ
jgi:hypothetical protein